MIVFSLRTAARSTIEFGALYRVSAGAVFAALADCDYLVDAGPTPEPGRALGLHEEYRIEAGPALLTVSADAFAGHVRFVLDGPRFGFDFGATRNDPVTWMRLVTLAVQYADAYRILADVADPHVGFGLTRGVWPPLRAVPDVTDT